MLLMLPLFAIRMEHGVCTNFKSTIKSSKPVTVTAMAVKNWELNYIHKINTLKIRRFYPTGLFTLNGQWNGISLLTFTYENNRAKGQKQATVQPNRPSATMLIVEIESYGNIVAIRSQFKNIREKRTLFKRGFASAFVFNGSKTKIK